MAPQKDSVDLTPAQQKEAANYASYLARYKDQDHLKARPARTGWTRRAPDYKICLWGSSLYDWST